ncbi:MAG: efflux RND transporter periplasmic adaptor subunit [Bdellovibrionota bacterium]
MKQLLFLFALCALSTFAASCGSAAQETHADEPETDTPSNIVELTKENLSHITLKTETAELGSLSMTLKAVGRVSLDLNKTAKVTSTLEGRIVSLSADINDRVHVGDVLARVQSPELLGKTLEIRSPIDGVVIERQGSPGENVDRAREIYTISNPDNLWVIAEIKERDIGAVKLGQETTFSVLSYPERRFQGRVVRIGNQVEPDSRTLEARIAVDNSEHALKAGMFADVEIATTVLNNVLVISDDALQTEESEQIAFVAVTDTTFEKRVLRLGLEEQGKVQVLEGLEPGEKVVTEGSFILKSELLKGELGEE